MEQPDFTVLPRRHLHRAVTADPRLDRLDDALDRLERDRPLHARALEAALLHLRELDGVAYIRFASVYRSFETTDEFQRELESLDFPGRTLVRSATL